MQLRKPVTIAEWTHFLWRQMFSGQCWVDRFRPLYYHITQIYLFSGSIIDMKTLRQSLARSLPSLSDPPSRLRNTVITEMIKRFLVVLPVIIHHREGLHFILNSLKWTAHVTYNLSFLATVAWRSGSHSHHNIILCDITELIHGSTNAFMKFNGYLRSSERRGGRMLCPEERSAVCVSRDIWGVDDTPVLKWHRLKESRR